MIEFQIPEEDITVFLGADMREEYITEYEALGHVGESLQEFIADGVEYYMCNFFGELEDEYLKCYSAQTGLQGIAILHAHGLDEGGKWYYCDGKNHRLVQAWLDRHDGQYACFVSNS